MKDAEAKQGSGFAGEKSLFGWGRGQNGHQRFKQTFKL